MPFVADKQIPWQDQRTLPDKCVFMAEQLLPVVNQTTRVELKWNVPAITEILITSLSILGRSDDMPRWICGPFVVDRNRSGITQIDRYTFGVRLLRDPERIEWVCSFDIHTNPPRPTWYVISDYPRGFVSCPNGKFIKNPPGIYVEVGHTEPNKWVDGTTIDGEPVVWTKEEDARKAAKRIILKRIEPFNENLRRLNDPFV